MAIGYSQGYAMLGIGARETVGEVGTVFALVDGGASADTITRSSGDFTDLFKAGDLIRVLGATDSDDDVETLIVSVAALVITLATGVFTTGETAGASIALVTSAGGTIPDVFNGGTLVFYTGTRPTSANDAIGTASELASIADIQFADAEWDATIDAATVSAVSLAATATASGTATWARFTAFGDNAEDASTTAKRIDYTVGQTTGDILLSKGTAINTGDPIAISYLKGSMPLRSS